MMIPGNDNIGAISLLKHDKGPYFEVVYKYYFTPLYAYATQFVENEDAKEIVQETMLWLWENKMQLTPELSLKSLLFTIVKNKSLNRDNHLRMKSRVLENIRLKYENQFDNPDFYTEKELNHILYETLDKLPDKLREVFEMSRFDGLTHKEIAEQLHVSPQTVNYRLGKVLDIFREKLKDYFPLVISAACFLFER